MRKEVLIVDDDPDVIMFITSLLESGNYKAIVAKNGEEAMAKVKEGKPDLVILDILMPKQSGIRMYRELKTTEYLKNIPVFIYSGISKRTFLRSQATLDEFGGEAVPAPEAYIEKPGEPEDILDTVRELLHQGSSSS
jgi:two-component system phosphate regulon response regulator PhoB